MEHERTPDRMCVLLVCAVNGMGGPIRSMQTVVGELHSSVDFHLASQISAPDRAGLEDEVARTYEMVRPRGFGFIRAQWQLLRRARQIRRDVDVVHANGLTEAAVVLPLALFTRLPVVVWVHNSSKPRTYAVIEPLVRRFGSRWRWAAVSTLAARLSPDETCAVIPNPVGPESIASARSSSESFRVTYMAGTDRAHKGFDLLPEIIRSAPSTRIRWSLYTSPPFTSTGDSCRQAWEFLTAQSDADIRINDRVSDVRPVFADTDLVLSPSRIESFNRVLAEAVANGIPFIATDLEPHRELCATSGAGRLFPRDEPAAAGALIKEICESPTMYEELRDAARTSANLFSRESICRELLALWTGSARGSDARSDAAQR